MQDKTKFYINGAWVVPHSADTLQVINPSTEEVVATITLGDAVDLDSAVTAATNAAVEWSQTSVDTRRELLQTTGYL